jgi:hypothetical protein
MASQECAKVEAARGWQDGVLRVNYRMVLSQAKGAWGRRLCLRFVWAESLLGVLEC